MCGGAEALQAWISGKGETRRDGRRGCKLPSARLLGPPKMEQWRNANVDGCGASAGKHLPWLRQVLCLWRSSWPGELLVYGEAAAVRGTGDRQPLLLSDVPGGGIQHPGCAILSGSMSSASRLLQEKHLAAASRQGSQQ